MFGRRKGSILLLTAVTLVLSAPTAFAAWSETSVQVDSVTTSHWLFTTAQVARGPNEEFFVYTPTEASRGWGNLACVDSTTVTRWRQPDLDDYTTDENENGVQIATDGAGGVYTIAHVISASAVRLRHTSPAGALDWSATLNPSSYQWNGHGLLADGNGGVWVAYVDGVVRLQHLLAGGAVAPGWNPLKGRVVGAGTAPALASDGAGGVLLCWNASGTERVARIQADSTTAPGWPAAGLALGSNATLPPYEPRPRLLPSGSNQLVAVWCALGWYGTVSARRFGLDGSIDPAWGGGQPVTTYSSFFMRQGTGYTPFTFSDGAGGFHHVWADSATGVPRWTHVLANGQFAPGYAWAGRPLLDANAVLAANGNFVAVPSNTGGMVLAWDDARPGQPLSVRLRWLMPDGSNDPGAPDTGRVVPLVGEQSGPGAAVVFGLEPDGAGGVWVLWRRNNASGTRGVMMNHMARTLYVADVPASPAPSRLVLDAPRPNPARGRIEVSCTLASDAPAALALHDVSGRLVRRVELLGAGSRTVSLERLGSLPPGVYLLSLTQGRERRVVRVALVR